jgi:selenophosphate synthetase-related protein
MKTLLSTFALLLITSLSFGQIEFDKIYASTSEEGTQYLRIYEDGLVLMVASKDELSKVKEYFTRDSDEKDYIILYKSQSKIKGGTKASFVLENDGNKINCIAQGNGATLTLVMMSPTMGKQQKEFKLVE